MLSRTMSARLVARHRRPMTVRRFHAVVDEVAHSVEHLAVAVRLRTTALCQEPGRHRHRGTDLGPLRVRHVTRIAAWPPPRSDRTEPVHVAVTPRGDRGAPGRVAFAWFDHVGRVRHRRLTGERNAARAESAVLQRHVVTLGGRPRRGQNEPAPDGPEGEPVDTVTPAGSPAGVVNVPATPLAL